MVSFAYLKFGGRLETDMFNFNNKKNKKVVSGVIIAIVILAMVLPMLSYMF